MAPHVIGWRRATSAQLYHARGPAWAINASDNLSRSCWLDDCPHVWLLQKKKRPPAASPNSISFWSPSLPCSSRWLGGGSHNGAAALLAGAHVLQLDAARGSVEASHRTVLVTWRAGQNLGASMSEKHWCTAPDEFCGSKHGCGCGWLSFAAASMDKVPVAFVRAYITKPELYRFSKSTKIGKPIKHTENLYSN